MLKEPKLDCREEYIDSSSIGERVKYEELNKKGFMLRVDSFQSSWGTQPTFECKSMDDYLFQRKLNYPENFLII